MNAINSTAAEMNSQPIWRPVLAPVASQVSDLQKIRDQIFRKLELILVATALAVTTVLLIPEVRSHVKEALSGQTRHTLSSLTAELAAGVNVSVVKTRTKTGIDIDIYENRRSEAEVLESALVGHIELSSARDAYFDFSGHLANLAVIDVDGDGEKEILVPMMDSNLVGRLAIYHYSSAQQQLIKIN